MACVLICRGDHRVARPGGISASAGNRSACSEAPGERGRPEQGGPAAAGWALYGTSRRQECLFQQVCESDSGLDGRVLQHPLQQRCLHFRVHTPLEGDALGRRGGPGLCAEAAAYRIRPELHQPRRCGMWGWARPSRPRDAQARGCDEMQSLSASETRAGPAAGARWHAAQTLRGLIPSLRQARQAVARLLAMPAGALSASGRRGCLRPGSKALELRACGRKEGLLSAVSWEAGGVGSWRWWQNPLSHTAACARGCAPRSPGTGVGARRLGLAPVPRGPASCGLAQECRRDAGRGPAARARGCHSRPGAELCGRGRTRARRVRRAQRPGGPHGRGQASDLRPGRSVRPAEQRKTNN